MRYRRMESNGCEMGTMGVRCALFVAVYEEHAIAVCSLRLRVKCGILQVKVGQEVRQSMNGGAGCALRCESLQESIPCIAEATNMY